MNLFHFGRFLRPHSPKLVENFMNLAAMLLFSINNYEYNRAKIIPRNRQTFDFIVVGSGSSGSVIGGRLSEISSWNILVLEAGAAPGSRLSIPGSYLTIFDSTEDWQYKTIPQVHAAFGNQEKKIKLPRGRTIGGTSAINAMTYVRGNPKDFDLWESQGNPGWNYGNVTEYFKKAENLTGDTHNRNVESWGRNGPITVKAESITTPFQRMIIEASKELGYDVIDVNGGKQIGINPLNLCVNNGERVSSADAYLRPHLNRRNLKLISKALVHKVIFDNENRAIGVEYIYNGHIYKAFAKKEVVLSAGTIGSPQLLMLSGIGNTNHLTDLKIPPLVDLPGVGQNLMDHVGIFGGLTFFKGSIKGRSLWDFLQPLNFESYSTKRTGIFAKLTGLEMTGHVSLSGRDPDWPDVNMQFPSSSILGDFGFNFFDSIGLNESFFRRYFEEIINERTFNINPNIIQAKSRGYIKLRSNKVSDYPIINTRTYQHPDDLDLIVKAIKEVLKLANTTAFKKRNIMFYDKQLHECQQHILRSDKYWKCYAQHFTSSFHHMAGTCKMAPPTDPWKVVDSKLRVYGTKSLRVIDASIMPTITAGNTHAPCIMIGEKGADMIKEYWLNSL